MCVLPSTGSGRYFYHKLALMEKKSPKRLSLKNNLYESFMGVKRAEHCNRLKSHGFLRFFLTNYTSDLPEIRTIFC